MQVVDQDGSLLGITPEGILLPVFVSILLPARLGQGSTDQVASDKLTRFTSATADSLRSE
jgi:hypothetical protein